MRKLITAVLVAMQTFAIAQRDNKFSGVVVQGKDTLDITKGLKSYEPIRFSWINNAPEELTAIEVHFGNGSTLFTTKYYTIAKDQKSIVFVLHEFLAIDRDDIQSPRKRQSDVSRIVILCLMENSKYRSFHIPFKIQD